ncbi:hypothetical protein BGAL_0370g00140 [Botrytis galanthina]|uniref:Uncharacterized protein n=1 Tax=Botrytis galanthina TaxID=278940 RepID=A0A4S8QR28_9HELO|nr:hypothetical protein BGAL_0370g00140 [Botrytis galanthina]
MASQGSSNSSRTKPVPQNGPKYGWRPVEDFTVPQSSGLKRNGGRVNGAPSRNKGNAKALPRSTQKREFHSIDSEGSQSGNSTDSSTKFRSRGRESNNDHATEGTTRSKTKIHAYSDSSDSEYHPDRYSSRRPRAAPRSSTSSKKAGSNPMIPGKYGIHDVYRNPVSEFSHVKIAKEAIPPDHRRRAESRSRQENHQSNRITDTDKINRAIAEISRHEYFKNDRKPRVADARPESAKMEYSDHDHKEQTVQFDSGPKEGSIIKREPIKEREQSRGPDIKRNAEPQPRHHGNGDKQLNPKVSFSSTHKPLGVESKIDGAWHNIGGKDKMRTQIPPANTNRGSANELPPDYGKNILEDWWKGQSHTARTTERAVVEQKPKSRYRADDNPSSASDQGRKHDKNPEQYTPKKDIFAEYDAPPEKKKKKRSLKAVFGSWQRKREG